MWKALAFCSLFTIAFGGIIHDHYEGHHEPAHEAEQETDHHHKVDHEHATSHQSFKIHHFHAVPVYVKKEDQQFLKHPVEISGVKHNLKLVHPETEKHHDYGLVLENHTEEKNHKELEQHDDHGSYHNFEPSEHHDFSEESSHHQYHDINLHHDHHSD